MAPEPPPAPEADLLLIGRFASSTGLTVPQLRHYDRLGVLQPAARDEHSGYRYYSGAQARSARVIALLRSIDMPLAGIRGLRAAPEPARIRQVFAQHRERVERRLAEARAVLESIDLIIEEGDLMDPETETRCSFCRKPSSEAPVRLVGPEGATICEACVDLALNVVELERRARQVRPPRTLPAPADRVSTCAFCGRDNTRVQMLVAGPEVCICDGCLDSLAA